MVVLVTVSSFQMVVSQYEDFKPENFMTFKQDIQQLVQICFEGKINIIFN